jgi:hypothetical protein
LPGFRKAAATGYGYFLPKFQPTMKNSILILAGAAALSLASCSQEKTTETSTTTTTGTEGTAMSGADMDAMAEARAQRIADRMVADMKITDEATKTKIRTVYVNRYRQMGDVRSKYTTDTTGMAAAVREANAATDAEFRTIFSDPAQYRTYETSRNTYYEMENEDMSMSDVGMNSSDMSSGSTSGSGTTSSTSGSTSGSGNMSGSASGTMSNDGGKVKIKSDGDVKIKDAQGNKLKVDGDDGTVKSKPENGNKTKIE